MSTSTDTPDAPATGPSSAGGPPRLTFFMLVRTTSIWLALSPPERFAFADDVLQPLLERYPQVSMRFFDSEAFNSRASDVLMWETDDIAAYQAVVESLRESPFWGTYFEVVEILPAIENAYARHYEEAPYGAERSADARS